MLALLVAGSEEKHESVGESDDDQQAELNTYTENVVAYRHSVENKGYCDYVEYSCVKCCLDDSDQLCQAGEAPDALVQVQIPKDNYGKDGIYWYEFIPGYKVTLGYVAEMAVESEPEAGEECDVHCDGIVKHEHKGNDLPVLPVPEGVEAAFGRLFALRAALGC